ncbi:MAG: hypothetical protein M3232_02355 [Thermoproteota archaeon]|nr:hypothetical protein [Thermoproteota archaeon]
MTEEQGSKSIKTAFLIDDNDRAKPMAGIAMTGMIIITALLLSGLSLIGNYSQPAMAQQQNVTGGGGENATTTGAAGGGNQSEARFHIEEALAALENNDTQSALTHLDLALNTLGGTSGTAGNVTTGTTIAGTDNADESSSRDANRRETDTEEEAASECGGVTVGGTSAADDYGCPPDPDY